MNFNCIVYDLNSQMSSTMIFGCLIMMVYNAKVGKRLQWFLQIFDAEYDEPSIFQLATINAKS